MEMKPMKLEDHPCVQKEATWKSVKKHSNVSKQSNVSKHSNVSKPSKSLKTPKVEICEVISLELEDFLKDKRNLLLSSFPVGEIHS